MEKEELGSEIFFQNIFENHTAVQLIIDPKDGRIVNANHAAVKFYGWPKEQLLQMKIGDINTLPPQALSEALQKAETKKQTQFEFKHRLASNSIRDVQVDSCSIKIKNKKLLHSIIQDISKRKNAEEAIKLNEARLESLLRINQFQVNNIQELLDFALEEIISLTQSEIGYIYFYNEEKREFTLNSWSKEVMSVCKVAEPKTKYELDKTGIWGEAVRQRKPILINEFNATNLSKKCVPEGHAPLKKFLTTPVFFNKKIVAVVGVGNKTSNYVDSDIRQLELMMDAVWKVVQRVESEERIRVSESRLRRAELASKMGNWELHLDSMLMLSSEGATKIYGLEKTINEYHAIKDIPLPEYRPLLDIAFNNLINNKKPYNIEFKIKRFNSNEIIDIHSIAEYDKENKIIFGTIQDITKRKKTEEKLLKEQLFIQTLIDNLPGIFFLYSYPNIELIRWNKNHESLFGYSSEEHKNIFARDWTRPELKQRLLQEMQSVIEQGFVQREISLYKKDGTEIPFLLTSVKVETKTQTYIMGVGADITDRKKTVNALVESEVRLKELNATKDKFFSIIAHDLKSPFNSILGLSDLLIEQIQQNNLNEIEEYAFIIHNSSKRALDLLLNLLEWSRSHTGRMEFNPEYIELGAIINDVTELMDDAIQRKNISISKKLSSKIIAFADKAMICTILRNLLSNAIKFTHLNGNIKIAVKKNVKEILISVSDNGIGIAEADIKKLFNMEENHSTLGTSNEKGTGLGLILCKEFVEKHQGTIGVESNVGNSMEQGSTFYFTIPIK